MRATTLLAFHPTLTLLLQYCGWLSSPAEPPADQGGASRLHNTLLFVMLEEDRTS